jgi:hypothetical protein
MKTRIAAFAVLASFAVVPVADAAAPAAVFGLRAAGNPKLGYFVYSAAPGRAIAGAVIVSNTGTKRGSVRLYATDGTTGDTTGTVYMTDDHPTRAGAWIQLATSSVTLAPGKFRRVGFTVHVPGSASPGEWVGGVVAESTEARQSGRTKQKAGVKIRIRNQTIIAVQVNVPGKRRAAFSIGSVKTGGQRGFQQLIVHLANTGNVLRKPSGKVEVVKAGHLVETLPFVMDTVLPQTSIDYPILLKRALTPGSYGARISLTFPNTAGTQKTISADPSFTVSKTDVKQVFTTATPTKQPKGGVLAPSKSSTPWAWIAAGIAGGLLLAIALWWILRRRRRDGREYVPTVVMPLPPLPATSFDEHQPLAPQAPAPVAEPSVTAPEQAPVLAPRPPESELCREGHLWQVAYDRGDLGRDGIWRFPHRCRTCGLELMATDAADASAQAHAPAASAR